MKNIANFTPDTYKDDENLTLVEEGIYSYHDEYVTSLCFEQEPEFGEGNAPSEISQYPLEDILDKFLVSISDDFKQLNENSNKLCYLEFSSPDINDIKNLRQIIGNHVYNDENNRLIIE